jgi:hypothetical protein
MVVRKRRGNSEKKYNFTNYTHVRVFPLNIIGGAIAAMTQNPTCTWHISSHCDAQYIEFHYMMRR